MDFVGHKQKLTINFTYSLHCRRAEQHGRCVSAIGCTNGDDLYQIYSIYKDLANGYLRLCENDTLSGSTVLSFLKICKRRLWPGNTGHVPGPQIFFWLDFPREIVYTNYVISVVVLLSYTVQ